MKFFIHVFVLLQTIILAYFAYVSPYYGFTDLNGEQLIGLTILSVFMQFITVSFIISSVCFLVDEKMVLNKNIGVKLIFLTNSIYFSVQAYFLIF